MTKYVAMLDGTAKVIIDDESMGAAADQAMQITGIDEDDLCIAEWDALTGDEQNECLREIAAIQQ